MTQKEKLKQEFLSQPRNLSYQKIKSLLLSEWFDVSEWKWSHTKIQHPKSWKVFIVPIHDWDCKSVYKEKLKEFYLDNLY